MLQTFGLIQYFKYCIQGLPKAENSDFALSNESIQHSLRNMYKFYWFKKFLLLSGLICLLLPNLLFLLGWYRPYVAIPFCCFFIFTIVFIYCKLSTSYLPVSSPIVCTGGDIAKLFVCLLGAFVIVETISFHGHFYQSMDFCVRNPIYLSLINKSWPLYDAKGGYFVYYHAFWLPPALLAKYIGGIISAPTLLFAWSYLHLAIGIGLLFCKLKGRVLTFCVILFFLGTIMPDYLHALDNLAESHYPAVYAWMLKYGLARLNLLYPTFWTSLTDIFNSTLPGFLCLALLFSGMFPKRYWCIPAALIIQPSLLCAGAMFIWLALSLLSSRRACRDVLVSPFTWGCTVFVFLTLLYFSCLGGEGSNNGIYFAWSQESFIGGEHGALARTIRAVLIGVTLILSFCCVLRNRLKKNCVFIGGCLIAAIIPFIWVGMINNEFCFKGSTVIFFLFSWLLSIQWRYADVKGKVFLVLFLLVSGLHITREFHCRHYFMDYGWSEEKTKRHINDPYQGSIDNMSDYIRSQFSGENRYPGILKSHMPQ